MAHIRTQVRNGIKARLIEKLGGDAELHVHNASRALKDFQKDNFPLILVAVTESVREVTDNEYDDGDRLVERDITVPLKISERTAFDDVEAKIDEMCVKVERAMAIPKTMGFGKFWNWSVGGASPPEIEWLSEDFALMSVVIPISFTLRTTAADPETNINP